MTFQEINQRLRELNFQRNKAKKVLKELSKSKRQLAEEYLKMQESCEHQNTIYCFDLEKRAAGLFEINTKEMCINCGKKFDSLLPDCKAVRNVTTVQEFKLYEQNVNKIENKLGVK